jgi:Tol biopolymer transport system component
MTAPNDADRLVHAFLQEGPAELSPPLQARIRDEILVTKQRAARRPWRSPTMPRIILVLAPVAAILVAILAMALAGSGGPPPAPSVVPSTRASAAVSASPSSSPTPTPGPASYPLALGEAWIALAGPENQAVLIRPDGSGRHEFVTSGVAVADVPIWSPDGNTLVFEGNGDRGSQLWLVDADGTNLRQLTPTPAGCPDGTCIEALMPAWSPDGRTIAYIAPQHDHAAFARTALMILDVASGTSTEVYGTGDAGLGRPTWSPDGKTIAFEIDHYDGIVEASAIKDTVIATIAADQPGGSPRIITKPSLLAGYPIWHPTDDVIVFRTNRLNNETLRMLDDQAASNVYTMAPDGSGMTKVTNYAVGGNAVRAPSWTPDGRILYTVYHPSTQEETLQLIEADGANETDATGSVVTKGQGRWRPGT